MVCENTQVIDYFIFICLFFICLFNQNIHQTSKTETDGDCRHEIKRCSLLGRKVMTNLDSILEKGMAPHSSTLAWKIPWTEEPGRLQSMRSLRVGHDWVTSLSLSLSCTGEGNGNPLQCSCLENPRDGGAWRAAVYGVTQSQTWLHRLSSSSIPIYGRRFMTLYRRQGSRPSPWKRNAKKQNGCLGRSYK